MIYDFDSLSFTPVTVKTYTHKQGVFNVKARPFASFSFRLSGTAHFEIGNKKFTSSAGDIIFIPANAPYKVDYSGGKSIVAHLQGCNYPEAEIILPSNERILKSKFELLLSVWCERHSANKFKSEFFDILACLEDEAKLGSVDAALAECIYILDDHYTDYDLNIEDVCRMAHISRSSIQRKFKQHLGVSPKQYLNRLRMTKALDMLADGSSVTDVAYACGFEDVKYFSRVFKRSFGCAPSNAVKNMFV